MPVLLVSNPCMDFILLSSLHFSTCSSAPLVILHSVDFLFVPCTGSHSRISGVFAVASMMVGNVMSNLITGESTLVSSIDNVTHSYKIYHSDVIPFHVTPMSIISALTFTVGVYQVFMALFRLTFVTTYMSDQMVAGYTAGSAFHVLISQLSKVFGIKTPHRSGFLMLPKVSKTQ